MKGKTLTPKDTKMIKPGWFVKKYFVRFIVTSGRGRRFIRYTTVRKDQTKNFWVYVHEVEG